MYINIDEINKEDFNVQERFLNEFGKVYLITPSFIKHKWSLNELHLRSLLIDTSGKVISSGAPKFFNYGEMPELDRLTEQSILSGQAVYPEKMDGSLIIRSVIKGKVHFRTRGSHTLVDEFESNVMNLVREKYPQLLDPSLDSRYSILFEYTGPENQIVVKYDSSSLTALGLMDLSAEPPEFLSSKEIVKELEDTYKTPAVRFHDLNGSLEEIKEQIKLWKGIEGIVVWSTLEDGKMLLCKIKAEEYLRIHTLKFQMTPERLFQYCWYHNITTLEQLKDNLYRYGVDWEGVNFLSPICESYLQKRELTIRLVSNLLEEICALKLQEKSRKEAVTSLKELTKENNLFNVGIEYLYGGGNIQRQIDAIILGVPVKKLDNLRKEISENQV